MCFYTRNPTTHSLCLIAESACGLGIVPGPPFSVPSSIFKLSLHAFTVCLQGVLLNQGHSHGGSHALEKEKEKRFAPVGHLGMRAVGSLGGAATSGMSITQRIRSM